MKTIQIRSKQLKNGIILHSQAVPCSRHSCYTIEINDFDVAPCNLRPAGEDNVDDKNGASKDILLHHQLFTMIGIRRRFMARCGLSGARFDGVAGVDGLG